MLEFLAFYLLQISKQFVELNLEQSPYIEQHLLPQQRQLLPDLKVIQQQKK